MECNLNQIIDETIAKFENCKEKLPYSYVPVKHISENAVSLCDEKIEIYLSDFLSDAWIKAYPQYIDIFQKEAEFKKKVNSASGKWLEPKYAKENYCILLSLKNVDSSEELIYVLAHELRHCYDFIKSVHVYNNKNGNKLPKDISKFSLWSEFNAVYSDTILRLYPFGETELLSFKELSSYFGYKTADCIAGMCRNEEQSDYYAMRFAGVHRAIRDMSENFSPSPVFQLWHIIPNFIEERYPRIFYFENEMQEFEFFDFRE